MFLQQYIVFDTLSEKVCHHEMLKVPTTAAPLGTSRPSEDHTHPFGTKHTWLSYKVN